MFWKWAEKNTATIILILTYAFGLAFSTGILWMKVEDNTREMRIIHKEIHSLHMKTEAPNVEDDSVPGH